MFKKFCYYYLLKKKKVSCQHSVGVGVASLILRHVSCRAISAEVRLCNRIIIFLIFTIQFMVTLTQNCIVTKNCMITCNQKLVTIFF